MIIAKRRIQIEDNLFADVEEHPKTEMPAHYPEKTDLLADGTLILWNCHSKHYIPTAEAKEKLAQKIKSAKSWGYAVLLQGRERSA